MDEEELQLKKELRERKKDELARRKRARETAVPEPSKPPQNTAIYISSLPSDKTTVDDLITEFSKYGIIKKDHETDQYKCKLYVDSDGKPKGDALLVYARPESTGMAIEMMDGYNFHGQKIKVELATFDQNPNTDDAEAQGHKRSKTHTSHKEESKLDDWSESSEDILTSVRDDDRIVILANIIDIYAELNSHEIAEIAQDLREGCEESGEIVSFKFDELLGQAQIEYASQEQAQKCCKI